MYTIKSSLNVFLICLLVLDSAAAESELPELLLAEVGSNSYCEEELCAAGEGDCDNDSQCESGLVCSNDVGLNYGFRDIVDVCEVPASGSDAYCNGRTCGVGEGDCDSDNQCESGLVCSDDVGAAYGFRAFVDVCELPSSPGMDDAGGDSFCDGRLCGVGEGDCDADNQCESGLVCSTDVGSNYGFRDIVDVCEVAEVGSNTYCDGRLCGIGEGDCDTDSQCEPGLVCTNDAGASYGFRAIVDVCEIPPSEPVSEAGSDDYCENTSCGVGEGDCDSDDQCSAGLVCSSDVGESYGFRGVVDVCELPASNDRTEPGSNTFCDANLCTAGEGDCDSDDQCAAGLICATDVGASYGFRSVVDICEADPDLADTWIDGQFEPESTFRALCAVPRSGIDSTTDLPYPDQQGTTLDENNWLRSWSNDFYLWYDEIIDRDPAGFSTLAYFDLLKTFETTASGSPRDNFHGSVDTETYHSSFVDGIDVSYGVTFSAIRSFPPRQIVVAYTEPDSPATRDTVNLARGALILEIDGVDVVSGNDLATINRGLAPTIAGESHDFVIQDVGADTTRSITLTAESVTSVPVQNVRTIETATGNVGYILFNDHMPSSEQLLIDAFSQLADANVNDLVLDLRYNLGGLIAIASELAYMIAGPTLTAGKTFVETQFNDKHTLFDPFTGLLLRPDPFLSIAVGLSAQTGTPLPSLNLDRVYVLTSATTCSASELVMNSLRGIDVEVIQIGTKTCGKPYGFYPTDNCGTTYFSIQIKAINAKGFGEYSNGFSPSQNPVFDTDVAGCTVADDFTHELGDVDESRLAAALGYRIDQSCPVSVGIDGPRLSTDPTDLSASDGIVRKHFWLENLIFKR